MASASIRPPKPNQCLQTRSPIETWESLRFKHAGICSKTSRAAAIAGILFSVLLILVFWLLRVSVPDDPLEPGAWLNSQSGTVALALNLVPFAGIALWFIGVLRDRLGEREDKFFSTVFFGSGLLFLAMLFAAASKG